MSLLILGLLLFLGIHSLRIFADGWRQVQLARLGEARWKGLYTVVSLAGFGLIVYGYGLGRAEPAVLWAPPIWARHTAALLTLPAFILIVAGNLPGSHIRAWVGHPMVAGVGLWALAHLLAHGRLPGVLLFAAFLAWTLAEFASLRRRDRLANRRYPVCCWTRDASVVAIGALVWALFAFYGHEWLIGTRPFAV